MKNIQELKEEFEKVRSSGDRSFIKFYEANIDSIDDIDPTLNEDNYNVKLRLQSEYGLSLVGAGYYTKAIPLIEDSIFMFEELYRADINKLYGITFFELLLFNLGRACWETKNILKASLTFNRLVENYPENEKYRSWLNGLKVEKVKKIIRPVWILWASLLQPHL